MACSFVSIAVTFQSCRLYIHTPERTTQTYTHIQTYTLLLLGVIGRRDSRKETTKGESIQVGRPVGFLWTDSDCLYRLFRSQVNSPHSVQLQLDVVKLIDLLHFN
jgi:hypothetical protein